MKPYRHILLFFILACSIGFGQESYVITGRVTSPTGELIDNVNIYFSPKTTQITQSKKNGNFSIELKYYGPVELVISHVSYEQKRILINKSILRPTINNELNLDIALDYKTLKQYIVTGKAKPDTVFGSEITSVYDYEFVGENMVLLSYRKSLKKNAFLQLTSRRNKLISTYKTPPNAKRLFKDFEGKLYLITKTKVFLISVVKNEFRLRPIDKVPFYKLTTRIIDTCNSRFIYSDFSDAYPAFNYYAQLPTDTVAKKLHHVENNFMMDLYRAEYKYAPAKQKLWAFRKELKTGIDKEIWIGATNFTQSLYYEPLYAPLFVNNDTILIFDHYSDQLLKINSSFEKLDSVPISYHKDKEKKNWEQPILKDKEEKKLYGLFLKHGYYYLKPIDLHDGTTSISFKLNYRYAENVKVENGYAYYIYRPYESSQKKYLYREVINTELD
ncbi:MAG: carboxypeptidase-like regulatory domain-containing protein [Flavobacteriales bacterium]